jgi:hypothetical protein
MSSRLSQDDYNTKKSKLMDFLKEVPDTSDPLCSSLGCHSQDAHYIAAGPLAVTLSVPFLRIFPILKIIAVLFPEAHLLQEKATSPLESVRKRIMLWEASFFKKNGHKVTVAEIQKNSEMLKLYITYRELKSINQQSEILLSSAPDGIHQADSSLASRAHLAPSASAPFEYMKPEYDLSARIANVPEDPENDPVADQADSSSASTAHLAPSATAPFEYMDPEYVLLRARIANVQEDPENDPVADRNAALSLVQSVEQVYPRPQAHGRHFNRPVLHTAKRGCAFRRIVVDDLPAPSHNILDDQPAPSHNIPHPGLPPLPALHPDTQESLERHGLFPFARGQSFTWDCNYFFPEPIDIDTEGEDTNRAISQKASSFI